MGKRLSVTLPDEMYEALEKLAAESNRVLADVSRDAIDAYLKAHGITVQVKVKRGGDRRTKPD